MAILRAHRVFWRINHHRVLQPKVTSQYPNLFRVLILPVIELAGPQLRAILRLAVYTTLTI
jgi:hypothetical protein